ncbi:MAG TPA: DUF1778 domain-containing protein [Candidatus Binatia bacterium]|nr:DUF1778 domain-containing protein [Candidatus Binatia bacterium]
MRTSAMRVQRQSKKEERLEARIPKAQKRILEHAASLRGTSLTDFVIASAQKEATQTIRDFEMLALCDEAREVFVNALINPPAPNENLRKAADRYKKHAEIG